MNNFILDGLTSNYESMRSLPIVAIYLDPRRQKVDGTYPIKLRITFNSKQQYYKLRISLTKKDFKRAMAANPTGKRYKEMKSFFRGIENRAHKIIDDMDVFSFEVFQQKYYKQDKQKHITDVFEVYRMYMAEMTEEGRLGNRHNLEYSYKSLKKFHKKDKLLYFLITPQWLREYENWMLKEGKSISSVGFYLRPLKTILNIMIEDGYMERSMYPFGKRKYIIPATKNVKKALSIEDLKKLLDYEPPTRPQQKAKDIWILSYMCNGINMKDMCLLRWSDIQGDTIVYIREKTKRTSKSSLTPIKIPYHPKVKEILEKWGKPDQEYIFGEVHKGMAQERIEKNVENFNRRTNKGMAKICKALEIPYATTYAARHSFATMLKRSDTTIAYISEALGHKDLKTTESYLGSFESERRMENANKLLDL